MESLHPERSEIARRMAEFRRITTINCVHCGIETQGTSRRMYCSSLCRLKEFRSKRKEARDSSQESQSPLNNRTGILESAGELSPFETSVRRILVSAELTPSQMLLVQAMLIRVTERIVDLVKIDPPDRLLQN